MSTLPPCVGRWELFDSNQPVDHLEARAICRTCPMQLACHDRLQQARRDAPLGGKDYGPQGTWAGQLVSREVKPRASVKTVERERHMFTADELRDGHRLYGQGDRTAAVVQRERIYQRNRKRNTKEAA